MIRNLKMLGLALVAVFAMSAMVASAASAADVFTSETEKTDLTGTTEEGVKPSLSITGGTQVVCEDTSYTGTTTKKTLTEITVHPVYNGPCKIGTTNATVDTEGCDYILTGTTDTVGGVTHATVSVECTSGKEILVTTAAGITLHIAAQGPLLGVTYTNIEETVDLKKIEALTINAEVKGITYSCTGAFCGLLKNNGNGNDGIYTDKVIATGYEDNGTFTQNATTHVWSGTHGTVTNITWSAGT